MIKCVIVEDEQLFSKNLEQLLKKSNAMLHIMDVCTDIESAILAIKKHKPELVFLDICLHGNAQGGFELLSTFKSIEFDVIFTTAYVDKNIQQIRACGLDFIVKPYVEEELSDALEKFNHKKFGVIRANQLHSLLRNLEVQDLDEHIISIFADIDNIVVKVKDIVYCKGSNQFTHLFIRDIYNPNVLKKFTLSKGIGKVIETLSAYNICQIHRSYMVNYKHVARYTSKTVKLRKFTTTAEGFEPELPISDGYRNAFLKLIGKL